MRIPIIGIGKSEFCDPNLIMDLRHEFIKRPAQLVVNCSQRYFSWFKFFDSNFLAFWKYNKNCPLTFQYFNECRFKFNKKSSRRTSATFRTKTIRKATASCATKISPAEIVQEKRHCKFRRCWFLAKSPVQWIRKFKFKVSFRCKRGKFEWKSNWKSNWTFWTKHQSYHQR